CLGWARPRPSVVPWYTHGRPAAERRSVRWTWELLHSSLLLRLHWYSCFSAAASSVRRRPHLPSPLSKLGDSSPLRGESDSLTSITLSLLTNAARLRWTSSSWAVGETPPVILPGTNQVISDLVCHRPPPISSSEPWLSVRRMGRGWPPARVRESASCRTR